MLAQRAEALVQLLADREDLLRLLREACDRYGVQLIADENADFTETNLDVAIRLVDGPGDLEGVELAPARRVVVAAPGAPDQWIAWPGAPLPDRARQDWPRARDAGAAPTRRAAGPKAANPPAALAADRRCGSGRQAAAPGVLPWA